MTSKNLPQSGTRKNNRDGGRKNTAALDAAAAEARAEIAAEEAAAAAPIVTLADRVGQRVECKVYGGFYWLDLVSYDVETATVRLPGGGTRELPVVGVDGFRYYDSCVIAPRAIA
jgi:hypothetical protein